MDNPLKSLISAIQRDKRFMGTCPACSEDFRLADAALFALNDGPPETALAAIAGIRERIKERKEDLATARARMTQRAERTAQAVNLGKIIEKIVPSFSSFSYASGDCRALFEPIDYVIFSGLTSAGRVDALHFVDIKSGKARLSETQRRIKQKVEVGAVKFITIRE